VGFLSPPINGIGLDQEVKAGGAVLGGVRA